LAVQETEADGRLLESAAIVFRDRREDGSEPKEWARDALCRYPAASLAVTLRSDTVVEIFSRNRNSILATLERSGGGQGPLDPSLIASAFHVWEAAGEIDAETSYRGKVMVGEEHFHVLIAPLAAVP
jgi:hypothetical protein